MHVRYSEEVDKAYKWIKYTAPYKDPLFTVVEISSDGHIKMSGKVSKYVGPSPWELGYPGHLKQFVKLIIPFDASKPVSFPNIPLPPSPVL